LMGWVTTQRAEKTKKKGWVGKKKTRAEGDNLDKVTGYRT